MLPKACACFGGLSSSLASPQISATKEKTASPALPEPSEKVTIEVFFDEKGRYDRHQIETETDPIAQDGIHTRIEAHLLN